MSVLDLFALNRVNKELTRRLAVETERRHSVERENRLLRARNAALMAYRAPREMADAPQLQTSFGHQDVDEPA